MQEIVKLSVVVLTFSGLTTAIADEATCTSCFEEGSAAKQRGELEHALSLFERGCEEDDGASCDAAALMLANGEGAPEDDNRAYALAMRSCNLGFAPGCRNLGASLILSSTAEVATHGRALLARACEGDSASGCGGLGRALTLGYGGEVDQAAGMRAMRRACELGYPPGCTSYGASLFAGDAADPAEARRLVAWACESGDPKGCGYLGSALRDGLGGPVDAVASNRYLEQACDGGQLPFCSELAAAVYNGTGGFERDPARAAALFKKACDGGWQMGCDNYQKLVKAPQRQPLEQRNTGLSVSGENLGFGSGNQASDAAGTQQKTTIGSMRVGQGGQTATLSDVSSSCGMFRLTMAFTAAAPSLRQCLEDSESRRVMLEITDGSVTSASVEPDDEMGRCAVRALADATLQGLTCSLEASVSR